MARGKRRRATSSALTASKRAWLEHLRACQRSGETLRGYAKRKGVSEHSLYQAAKELRRLGAWAPGQRQAPSAFVRVETPARTGTESAWRIRLPNGVSLEGAAPLSPESLSALVQELSRL
jgi:hypothetical protein